MAEYKFRAECLDDVARLHRTLSEKKVPVKMEISKKDPWLPEVDVYDNARENPPSVHGAG